MIERDDALAFQPNRTSDAPYRGLTLVGSTLLVLAFTGFLWVLVVGLVIAGMHATAFPFSAFVGLVLRTAFAPFG